MKKINLGIIGCGYWGPNFVRNFSQMTGVQISGICDMNLDKLAHMKQMYRNIRTYRDYQSLFKNNKLDAVIISTPASTHYSITKEALTKNMHVLVEKPISIKEEEAEELIKLSAKLKKILMVGHTFLYNPAVRKIKEIIEQKKLGKIYYIHSRRTNLGPIRKDVNAIWDLSPHDISIINYLLESKPLEVSAYSQRFLSHILEDVGFVVLRYPHNVLVHLHTSWLDPKKIREMTIIGDKKMLVYDDTNTNEPIKIYDKSVMKRKYDKEYKSFQEYQLIIKNGQVDIIQVDMQEPLKIECQHFIDCITSSTRPLTDGENGLTVLSVLAAIDKSIAKKGAFVKVQ
jgi:predicted dehydrogenase